MKQMDIQEEMKEAIDCSDLSLPLTVRVLKPLLYRDGDRFCVVFGPNPQAGIFGCGNTANEALQNWNTNLRERINEPNENDEVASYVKKVL